MSERGGAIGLFGATRCGGEPAALDHRRFAASVSTQTRGALPRDAQFHEARPRLARAAHHVSSPRAVLAKPSRRRCNEANEHRTMAHRALPVAVRASRRSVATVSRGVRGYEETLQRNWSDNVTFGAAQVQAPSSLAELQESVKDAAAPCRVVGRGHSFSPVAECGGGTLLSLHHLNEILDFEAPAAGGLGSITVQGGTTYTEIASFLSGRGALRNLPSCPQFTVAGAIATGTHGSGVHIQSLACDVSMIEFVRVDGSLVRSRVVE